MNFFEHQAAARRNSSRLVLLFALAVAGIVIAVDLVVLLAFGGESSGACCWCSPRCVTLGVIGLGSLYRIASLRGGGEAVALQMGGVAVPEHSNDFNLRRLRNVVEEIAIASGVPMPKLYVLEHEAAINAFAAGYSPSDAVVAVTRGALEKLNRDELQGVIAHEFSHILNGDMRLNIRLIGVLFGILMIALIGRKILQHGRWATATARAPLAILAAALVAMIVGFIGLFFGRLIKAGVSRSRERLADASAVQFTRQTAGLAGALKKIGGVHEGSRLSHRGDAEEISHMLFGDGVGLSAWFATHPPLARTHPGAGAGLQRRAARASEMPVAGDAAERPRRRRAPGSDRSQGTAAPAGGGRPAGASTPRLVAAQVAQPACRRLPSCRRDRCAHAGRTARAGGAARRGDTAAAVALLDDDPSGWPQVADKQAFEIAARLGKAMALEMRDAAPASHRDIASVAAPAAGVAGVSRCCACVRGRNWTSSSMPPMRWSMRTATSRCSNTAWRACSPCTCASRWIRRAMRALVARS